MFTGFYPFMDRDEHYLQPTIDPWDIQFRSSLPFVYHEDAFDCLFCKHSVLFSLAYISRNFWK